MMMTCLKREFWWAWGVLTITSLSLPGVTSANVLYDQDFETFATGATDVDGWWRYGGDAGFTNPVWEVQPYGGSQALVYQADGAATFGNSWYWYAGIGRSDLAGSLNQVAAQVTLSLDLAVVGAENTTPLTLKVTQWDAMAMAESWATEWTPTLNTDGSFSTFSATLDTGSQTGVYDPSRGLSINGIGFNNGGFGLDDGNQVIIDNVRLTTVPEPAGLFLLASSALAMGASFRRRRR